MLNFICCFITKTYEHSLEYEPCQVANNWKTKKILKILEKGNDALYDAMHMLCSLYKVCVVGHGVTCKTSE